MKKWKCSPLSRVRLFVTPWAVAHQAPPSAGFSRQESWSGLPFPPAGVFLTQRSNPGLPHRRQTLYQLSRQGKTIRRFLKKLKIELQYDPAIPLLGIYLGKVQTLTSKRYVPCSVHRSTVYNSQDMEATQVPSMDDGLKKMWDTQVYIILLSYHVLY